MSLEEAKYKVNKNIPILSYYQAKRIILNELSSGSLKQGDKLPGETKFCECPGLSRPTMHQALNELVSKGVLMRERKSGTFMTQPKIELKTNTGVEHLKHYLEMSSRGCGVEILDLCVTGGAEETDQRSGLESHDELIYLKRMWRIEETLIVYSVAYLSSERFPAVLERDFREINLFEVLEVEHGVWVKGRAVKIKSTLANKYDLELLEIDRTRALLLCMTDVIEGGGGRPSCYLVVRCRGDKFRISHDCEAWNIEV